MAHSRRRGAGAAAAGGADGGGDRADLPRRRGARDDQGVHRQAGARAVRRRGAGAARVGRRHRELPVGSRDAPADRGRLARQPAGRQAVPLGAARRAVPRRGRAARRGGGRVRAEEAARSQQGDRAGGGCVAGVARRSARPGAARHARQGARVPRREHAQGGELRRDEDDPHAARAASCAASSSRTAPIEAKIKDETKATVRCIPLEQSGLSGRCIYTGEPTDIEVLFAVAY